MLKRENPGKDGSKSQTMPRTESKSGKDIGNPQAKDGHDMGAIWVTRSFHRRCSILGLKTLRELNLGSTTDSALFPRRGGACETAVES